MGAILPKYDDDEEYEDDDDLPDEESDMTEEDSNNRDVAENICFDSATDTTDATPPAMTKPITITLEQVMSIENELEVYEKVSLIYLLVNDPSALNQLQQLLKNNDEKLIYNWAIQQNLNNEKWQAKLIEGICIIQNYQILRGLGFTKEMLGPVFLPHHSFTSLHINKVRKALYFMCEGFDQNDVTQLLDLTCRDMQKKGVGFKLWNIQYLELYLLHWESIGYIKHDNLSNLCAVLKHMDQLDLCENLKQLVPTIITPSTSSSRTSDGNKKDKTIFDEILNSNTSLLQFASLESHISADNAVFVSSENKYDIHPDKPGVCLIINQENFYREIDPACQHLLPPAETKLDSRQGTGRDKEQLEMTFQHFGFKTITRDNLSHTEIPRKIEEVMMTITDESSFFVCIMSHGDEGVIYGVNSCRVPVKAIQRLLMSKNRSRLAGKPKVLILQSCQGTRCQRIDEDDDIELDGPSSMSEMVPRCADLFTFWATVAGYSAIRNKRTGSWFIQSFCENLKTFGNKYHFDDICTRVISDVSGKKGKQHAEEVAMVPQKDSTFRKLFYMPPFRS